MEPVQDPGLFLIIGLIFGLDLGMGPGLGIMAGLDLCSGVVIDENDKKDK